MGFAGCALALLGACGSDSSGAAVGKVAIQRDAGHTRYPSDAGTQARSVSGGSVTSVVIDAGASNACPQGTSYEAFAGPFFEARCNSCHSAALEGDARVGAPVGVDFDTELDVLRQATTVWSVVFESQTMPIGAAPSECELQGLETYLLGVGTAACEPQCAERDCGSDGCGGVCGTCGDGYSCDAFSGACQAAACTPECLGRACGDDGCGGFCGSCGDGLSCSALGQCHCEPQCEGASCGDDGCGGSCGSCAPGEACTAARLCRCVPSCEGLTCGDDGCGGSCGTCPFGLSCTTGGSRCECVPDCSGKSCGDDGCGGSCGGCPGALVCSSRESKCVASCIPDCSGRVCGDDGCGGSCGLCSSGEYCDSRGVCMCEPQCLGRACGDDGCGSTCGQCLNATTCDAAGQCACEPNCGGKSCGDDGCGGTCGQCASSESCSQGACVALCIPSCIDQVCGDDGCGGSCGACPTGANCEAGQCAWPQLSFADDVYPLLVGAGCGGNCHGGARPAEGLDLSSVAIAYAQLVDQPSAQCSSRWLVQSGVPDSSYLVHKVTGTQLCSGSKMPKSGVGIDAQGLEVLRAWIGSGAGP